MVDAGDVEAGIAEMYEVKERVLRHTTSMVTGRVHINLPSALESVGRSRDAVTVLREGIELARKAGLLDTEAWVWGNLSESLYALGQWDEAVEAARNALGVGLSGKPFGSGATRLAHLTLARGDLAEAARQLAAARVHFGTHDPMPQHSLPLVHTAIGIAAGEGRLLDARAALVDTLDAGFPPGTQRYGWPLLLAAATAEADARGLPVAEAGRAEILERLRKAAKSLAIGAPVWLAHEQWVRAELRRAEGTADPHEWSEAVTAFEPLERPYDLARVRHRLAESLLISGADEDDRARATELLRLAGAAADHLGARPLADAVALLAQRARLAVGRVPEPSAPACADPVEALGLTSRERDVLRLVAAGRSNRQIAEELFISPKTASVHVSNILAKLDVSGRGEAAALAHRLRLFPQETPTARTAG
jgi:DNA-binding CsgD family transcriptional regulator